MAPQVKALEAVDFKAERSLRGSKMRNQAKKNGVATSQVTWLISEKQRDACGEGVEGIFLSFLEIKSWRGLLVVRNGLLWPGCH